LKPTPEVTARLAELRASRGARSTSGDYVLGEGDLLAIEAVNLPEMTKKVRVDGQGNINLPLVDTVPVGGRTVAQVQKDLSARLRKYLYDPQVSVFVEEYRSQQIAVMGAVQRPGLISDTGNHTSVLDAISAAGGMTADAGSRLYLIPAESRPGGKTTAGVRTVASADDVNRLADAAPIVVDTAAVDESVQQQFFSLPVHGGDVIVVPRAGEFVADGWLMKPGTYPITSGLTLRGAIATAGGFAFPADKHNVRIVHSAPNGATQVRDVNYDHVVAEKTPDIFIQQGDVVEVGSTKAKLIPYGFYKVAADIIRVGAGIRVGP
jgi:polysaccharide export outer membrane protein